MIIQMRRICSIIWILILFVTSAQADSVSATRSTIQAAYKSSDVALARKDSKTLLSLLAPNYQFINEKGQKLSRADMSRRMSLWFSTSKWLKAKTMIKKFSLAGGKALVTIEEQAEAAGVNQQTKKVMKLVSRATAEETWVKIRGKWLKQRTKTLSVKQLVDGKPYKP